MGSHTNSPRVLKSESPILPTSSSSSSLSSDDHSPKNLILRPSWFLFWLILSLLLLTFFIQWRGGYIDPISRLSHSAADDSPGSGCAIDFTKIWKFYNDSNVSPKICITSTTSASLDDVLPWIFYHKVVGVTNFFLFVEGKAANPNVSLVLQSIPGVKVIPRTRELEEQQAKSRIMNETWLASAFHKPCNGVLFVKQTLNMEMAIAMAREAGMEWILHLDTDELLHPAGSQDYSVRQIFAKVPTNVDALIFHNYESAVERDDIKVPFNEVSLFKKNFGHLPNDSNFELYRLATRGNPNYFLTYGNGKSAARIQDNLRPNGAHRWYNYVKQPKELESDEAAVLHYTYARFSDLTSRRDRCNKCQPTKEDVKRCFWLEFDQSAYIIASTETPEKMLQWYQDHVVWTNEEMNLRLLKYGVMTRIYTPMVIIQKLRESGLFASVIASAQAPSP
ncbi:unnamed protein product [Amaranthus hypochondriacus]